MPPPPVVYSPSNALSTPELSLTDPMLFDWLDGLSTDSEDAFDVGLLAVAFGSPSRDTNVPLPTQPQLPFAGLNRVPLECLEGLSHPLRGAHAAGTEMVSTRVLRRSAGGAAIEDMAPELRLQRLIQVSEQHQIVRNQRASSPEAERLVQAIHRSHCELDALRRQKLDAYKKDGNCGCNSSFECNICLEAAKEPVVTPCGHLFCWPCLYQWLHGHSAHSECPVCKGEVLEVNVTPIYGRGGDERHASSNDVPPRPRANRRESLVQQLQMADRRGVESLVRRMIENHDIVRGQAAPPVGGVEVTVFPAARSRARVGRQQRRNLASPSGNAAPENGNQFQLPSFNSYNAAPTDPQQSSSLEQASTSSTMAVIVGQAAQSRRSRPSESTTTRRTRRRQQQ
jgi:E3 ubiquitin-protein ligase RNF5